MSKHQEGIDFDAHIRLLVYRFFVETGQTPTRSEIAHQAKVSLDQVTAAFERLAKGKALVLQPGSGEVLMAEPFSAVPTAFEVRCGEMSWWGNCIWDALGIPAMLDQDATVHTSWGACGEAMRLDVKAGELLPANGVVHYSVPAHRWWQDVVFA